MKFWILAACAAVAVAASRPDSNVTGTIPAQYLDHIAAAGDLTVRGKRSNTIRYTVRSGGARIELHGGRLIFPDAANVHLEVPRNINMLSLSSAAGSIDAADLDGSVAASTSAGKITLDRIGGDVEVQSGGGTTLLGTIGGSVRCYSRGGNIRAIRIRGQSEFETGGGDIRLGDVAGTVRALTAAGGIHIDQAHSQVIAETLGGPIAIWRAFGAVAATSAGGPIDIGGATSVHCQSASGAIRLNNVSGTLRAAAGRGSIVAEILRGHPLADSALSTEAGDITVFVPSDKGVRIEAETAGTRDERSIVSEFNGLRVIARRSSVWARGEINGGGPLLRLNAAGGRIEIRRK